MNSETSQHKHKHLVITINRQYGSGGREVGQLLAEKLHLTYYDKEILNISAQRTGLDPQHLEDIDEKGLSTVNYLLNLVNGLGGLNEHMPMYDKVFVEQSKTIKQAAHMGPSLFVGRCADAILDDNDNYTVVKILLHSKPQQRLERIMQRNNLDEEQAAQRLRSVSKQRMSYYEHYSGRKWGIAENYDLVISTAHLSAQEVTDIIYSYITHTFTN